MPFITTRSQIAVLTNDKAIKRRIRKKKPSALLPPDNIARSYLSFLLSIVADWKRFYISSIDVHLPGLEAQSVQLQPKNARQNDSLQVRTDLWAQDLARLLANFEIKLNKSLPPVKTMALDIGQRTSKWNDTHWRKAMRSVLGIELYYREPWLLETIDAFAQENVSLITKTAQSTKSEIEELINRGYKQGLRHETISKQILTGTDLKPGIFKKLETRTNLIARDQVSKLNGQLTRLRQTELEIEHYTWRTMLDERVRVPAHSAMEGKICRWDDSTVFKHSMSDKTWLKRTSISGTESHPGQDYRCRCYGEPVFEDII